MYTGETDEELIQYVLPFHTVNLSLNQQEKLVQDEIAEGDTKKCLYTGECSCQNVCEKVVNLLVVGQTGAGKTTLIDSFVNNLLGIDLEDKFRYRLVDERNLIEERTQHDGTL